MTAADAPRGTVLAGYRIDSLAAGLALCTWAFDRAPVRRWR
ncbi:MAG: hypothetical protein U1F67_05675 [Rubrivivax sp.]